jgi:hypothetical protein
MLSIAAVGQNLGAVMVSNWPALPSSPLCGACRAACLSLDPEFPWLSVAVPAIHRLVSARLARVVFVFHHRLSRPSCCNIITKSTHATMKVTIREWNAVAAWRWDMPDDDVCGICRNPYDSTCSKCKFPGDECPLREFDLETYVEANY